MFNPVDPAMFATDVAHLRAGRFARLGYVAVLRDDHPDAVAVCASPAEALNALRSSRLLESLITEGTVQCYAVDACLPLGVAHLHGLLASGETAVFFH